MTAPTIKSWPLGRVGDTPDPTHVAYEDAWQSMGQWWRPTGVLPSFADDFLGTYSQMLRVFADSSGMQAKINPGRAWIKGAYLEIDATLSEYTLPITAAHATLGRMDRVVARLDKSVSPTVVGVYVKAGTPNATPSAGLPALTQTSSVWEIGLATVLVDAAAVTIAAGKVTDERVYSLVETVLKKTVLTADTATIDFDSSVILPIWSELTLEVIARSSLAASADTLSLRLGNANAADANNNYYNARVYGTNAGASGNAADAQNFAYAGFITGNTSPANAAGSVLIRLPGYANTTFMKQWNSLTHYRDATFGAAGTAGGSWAVVTSPVNFIRLFCGGNFRAGSQFILRGRP